MHFTYFLFKPDFTSTDQALTAIRPFSMQSSVTTYLLSAETGRHAREVISCIGIDMSDPPEWTPLASSLGMQVDFTKSARYSLLVLIKAKVVQLVEEVELAPDGVETIISNEVVLERIFAITTGDAWNRIPLNVTVSNFGKEVVLNWSNSDDLRELETDAQGRRGKRTNQKLHNPGEVRDFALFEDLFSVLKIGSKIGTATGEESLVGGRSLRYRGEIDADSLVKNCDIILEKFLDNENRHSDFLDIEPVEEITAEDLRNVIDQVFYQSLVSNDAMDIGFSEPEPREDGGTYWLRYKLTLADTRYRYFQITDWRTNAFRAFLKAHLTDFARQASCQVCLRLFLKDEQGNLVTFDDGAPRLKEVSFEPLLKFVSYISEAANGKKSIISDNRYFQVAAELHERLNARVSKISLLDSPLPVFNRSIDISQQENRVVFSEGSYNARICTNIPTRTNFDRAECRMQINRSRVEVCDVFENGNLFCVKRGISSDQVAYLCKQVEDAAICLESYDTYWPFLETKLETPYPFNPLDAPERFTFVIAFITNDEVDDLSDLPLKAKLALAKCLRHCSSLRFGFKYLLIRDIPGN